MAATPIVAVMATKKETPGKVVFEEIDASPHFDTCGVRLNIYVPKHSAKTMLDGADTVTLMLEAGDQTKAAS